MGLALLRSKLRQFSTAAYGAKRKWRRTHFVMHHLLLSGLITTSQMSFLARQTAFPLSRESLEKEHLLVTKVFKLVGGSARDKKVTHHPRNKWQHCLEPSGTTGRGEVAIKRLTVKHDDASGIISWELPCTDYCYLHRVHPSIYLYIHWYIHIYASISIHSHIYLVNIANLYQYNYINIYFIYICYIHTGIIRFFSIFWEFLLLLC